MEDFTSEDLTFYLTDSPSPRMEMVIRSEKGREWANQMLDSPLPADRDKVIVADNIDEIRQAGHAVEEAAKGGLIKVRFRGYTMHNGHVVWI